MTECQYCYYEFDGLLRLSYLLNCGHKFCKLCYKLLISNNFHSCPFDGVYLGNPIVDYSSSRPSELLCNNHQLPAKVFCQSHYQLICAECQEFHSACTSFKIINKNSLIQKLKTNIQSLKNAKLRLLNYPLSDQWISLRSSIELTDHTLAKFEDWYENIEDAYFSRDSNLCSEKLSNFEFLNHILIETMKKENEYLNELILGVREHSVSFEQYHPVLDKDVRDLPENLLIQSSLRNETGIQRLFNEIDVNREQDRFFQCLVFNESDPVNLLEIGFGSLRDLPGQTLSFSIISITLKSGDNERLVASNLTLKCSKSIFDRIPVNPPFELHPRLPYILSIETKGLNNYIFYSQTSSKFKLKLSETKDYVGDFPILYFKTINL